MAKQNKPHHTQPNLYAKIFIVWWLVLALLLVAACVPLSPAQIVRPDSPLIPGKNTTLTANRWRLVEITDQGENVAIDAIQPVYFTFTVNGELLEHAPNCNSVGYYIIAESEQHYRLTLGPTTAPRCGAIEGKQYRRVGEAVLATTAYELHDPQLVLGGKDVRVVLEIDNPP